MRRLLCFVVLGVLTTAGLGQAAGPKDYAKGAGTQVGGVSFWFNATSDPAGGSPTGTIRITTTSGSQEVEIVATVTCMATIGNPLLGGGTAVMGGDITRTRPSGVLPPGIDGIIATAFDTGQPNGTNDALSWNLLTNGPPEHACVHNPAFLVPLAEGDITVLDE